MRRIALGCVAALLSAATLTGCDDRPCLASHYDYMPMIVSGPKGMTHVTITPIWVCDKYGPAKGKQ